MIKAIIFDIDNTLYDYDKAQKAAMNALATFTCENLEISMDEFRNAFNLARNETKKLARNLGSSHSRMVYCQKTLEYLGYRPITFALDMYDIFWNTFLEHMECDDDLQRVMEYFKCREIKIGICTDLTTHIQHRKLKQMRIEQYVDAMVTSEEAGAEKPDLKVFKLILKKVGVLPQEALYVGDSLHKDMQGAGTVGMTPIWIEGNPKICSKYHIITGLGELLNYEF